MQGMSSKCFVFAHMAVLMRLVPRNVEAGLGGKSDPYLRVMLQGVVKARTDVINNSEPRLASWIHSV